MIGWYYTPWWRLAFAVAFFALAAWFFITWRKDRHRRNSWILLVGGSLMALDGIFLLVRAVTT